MCARIMEAPATAAAAPHKPSCSSCATMLWYSCVRCSSIGFLWGGARLSAPRPPRSNTGQRRGCRQGQQRCAASSRSRCRHQAPAASSIARSSSRIAAGRRQAASPAQQAQQAHHAAEPAAPPHAKPAGPWQCKSGHRIVGSRHRLRRACPATSHQQLSALKVSTSWASLLRAVRAASVPRVRGYGGRRRRRGNSIR